MIDAIQSLNKWIGRRWYRSLIAMVSLSVSAIPIVLCVAAVLNMGPLVVGALSGGLVGIAYAATAATVTTATAMRGPMVLPAVMMIGMSTLAFAALPLIEILPIPASYCEYVWHWQTLGMLIGSIAYTRIHEIQCVGRGGQIMNSRSVFGDISLVLFTLLFFYSQHHADLYVYAIGDTGFVAAVSLVISGVASAWALLTLRYQRDRRASYGATVPVIVVAMIVFFQQLTWTADIDLSWTVFYALLIVAVMTWCVANEWFRALLRQHCWKWQKRDSNEMLPAFPDRTTTVLRQVDAWYYGWVCVGGLFLAAMTSSLCEQTVVRLITRGLYFQGLYWALSVPHWIWTGTVAAFAVLAAHQQRSLFQLCLLTTVSVFVIAAGIYDFSVYPSFVLLTLAIPIPVAIYLRGMVSIAEQTSGKTIGMATYSRQRLSIFALMMLTLVLGIEFTVLRFSDFSLTVLWAVFPRIVLTVTLSFTILRGYFTGLTPAVGIVGGIVFFAISLNVYRLDASFFVFLAIFITTQLVIARVLFRSGWRSVPVQQSI